MQTQLDAPQAEFLQTVIASGRYRDESDALNEAVRLLQRRDELRLLLEQGERELDAGQGRDGEEVFARLEKRAKNAAPASGDSA